MSKDNRLQTRVSDELYERFNGKPDDVKEALTLYLRAEQSFLKHYIETSETVE